METTKTRGEQNLVLATLLFDPWNMGYSLALCRVMEDFTIHIKSIVWEERDVGSWATAYRF